ncbi:MAG: hypothetical protein ABIR80_06305, partial [Opitutaceae bacterium]
MKLPALVLSASLAANVAFFVAFAFQPALAPSALRDFLAKDAGKKTSIASAASTTTSAAATRKTAGAKPSASLWSQFDSTDLPTLIARLRAAGFSPATIKAVINAQIEARHADRINQLFGALVDTPYWKPEPTYSNYPAVFEASGQINRERTKLLRELLGDD